MEKTLASIYLDASHPESFGGLDAVYTERSKRKGRLRFLGNSLKIG